MEASDLDFLNNSKGFKYFYLITLNICIYYQYLTLTKAAFI